MSRYLEISCDLKVNFLHYNIKIQYAQVITFAFDGSMFSVVLIYFCLPKEGLLLESQGAYDITGNDASIVDLVAISGIFFQTLLSINLPAITMIYNMNDDLLYT